MIKIPEKAETLIVEASIILGAVGSAAISASVYLPETYKPIAASVGAILITASVAIMTVWHKFVNVATGKETTTEVTTVTNPPASLATTTTTTPPALTPIEKPV